MQYVDRPAHVKALPQPSGEPRARMELKPTRGVLRSKRRHRIGRQRRRRWRLGQRAAIRPTKLERAVGHTLDLVTLFVDRAVMATAK